MSSQTETVKLTACEAEKGLADYQTRMAALCNATVTTTTLRRRVIPTPVVMEDGESDLHKKVEDAANAAFVDAKIESAMAVPDEPVTCQKIIDAAEKDSEILNADDALVQQGLDKIAKGCTLRLLPRGKEYDPDTESFECGRSARIVSVIKHTIAFEIQVGVLSELIVSYVYVEHTLCNVCTIRFGNPFALAAVMDTYSQSFNTVMKKIVARLLILHPKEMMKVWKAFPTTSDSYEDVTPWNNWREMLNLLNELVFNHAPNSDYEERGFRIPSENEKEEIRVLWYIVDKLWGETYQYIQCTGGSGEVLDLTYTFDPKILEAGRNVAFHAKSGKVLDHFENENGPTEYDEDTHKKTDAAIQLEKFESSHNNPEAAARLAPFGQSCEGKVAVYVHRNGSNVASASAAAAAEVDLETVDSDEEDKDETIDGPELEENDDPEPEDLRVISPEAAASQAAFVAQIEAKAKADYEIAVLARKATAFLKEMDEQEKMEIKVAEFKSKQDEKKKTPKRHIITVSDSDETESESESEKEKEKEEEVEKGPANKRAKLEHTRDIFRSAFSGTVVYDKKADNLRVMMDGCGGKLSPPLAAMNDSPVVLTQLRDLDEGDRVQVIVKEWSKVRVVINSLSVFDPQITYMRLPYDPKKQSVLLSNGKYIPVNTRGVNSERVLDSVVNETGLRMIEFSVSKFMPGFMEVTSATLL